MPLIFIKLTWTIFRNMYIIKYLYCETPIPKAQRSGIGKLNNPAQRRVLYP